MSKCLFAVQNSLLTRIGVYIQLSIRFNSFDLGVTQEEVTTYTKYYISCQLNCNKFEVRHKLILLFQFRFAYKIKCIEHSVFSENGQDHGYMMHIVGEFQALYYMPQLQNCHCYLQWRQQFPRMRYSYLKRQRYLNRVQKAEYALG